MKEILDKGLDYMSSEKSGDDGVILYRRVLPWLKPKYSNSLKALDKVYYNTLSAKSKGMVRRREDGEASGRPVPSNPLQFAVMDENEDPADLDLYLTSMETIINSNCVELLHKYDSLIIIIINMLQLPTV